MFLKKQTKSNSPSVKKNSPIRSHSKSDHHHKNLIKQIQGIPDQANEGNNKAFFHSKYGNSYFMKLFLLN